MTTIRPETTAVLAHTPGFGGEAAGLRGLLQCGFGDASVALLLGIEAREMLADDLVGGVTLDAFGARVPAHDMALRVEHVDCIIHDAADQEVV